MNDQFGRLAFFSIQTDNQFLRKRFRYGSHSSVESFEMKKLPIPEAFNLKLVDSVGRFSWKVQLKSPWNWIWLRTYAPTNWRLSVCRAIRGKLISWRGSFSLLPQLFGAVGDSCNARLSVGPTVSGWSLQPVNWTVLTEQCARCMAMAEFAEMQQMHKCFIWPVLKASEATSEPTSKPTKPCLSWTLKLSSLA